MLRSIYGSYTNIPPCHLPREHFSFQEHVGYITNAIGVYIVGPRACSHVCTTMHTLGHAQSWAPRQSSSRGCTASTWCLPCPRCLQLCLRPFLPCPWPPLQRQTIGPLPLPRVDYPAGFPAMVATLANSLAVVAYARNIRLPYHACG
jgi:hypothetical protein